MSKIIGFIGLGSIGEGMARNLVENGNIVRGYDIREEARARLAANGGIAVDSPAATAHGADILLITVFNVEQAREVLFGKDGALAVLPAGAVVGMHTTMSPNEIRELARQVEAGGHLFVDAPVTGGVIGAESATLTIMAAGSDEALMAVYSAFEAMGSRTALCGAEVGAAATVKMINQLMVGAQVALAAEAMTLAVKAGANPHIVFDVVGSGAAQSDVWDTRVPDMIARDFSPKGVVDIFVKDLKIVMDGARDAGAYTPLAATALQLFQSASSNGLGRDADCGVVRIYERLAGMQP
jgi:putative dehydrogenase